MLPWLDRPFRELLRLAWPIAVSMVSYATMTLVDTLFVGTLGPSALAGVGLAGVAAFTIICFAIGLLRAVKILTAQAVGAGRRQELKAYLGAGLYVAVALGLSMTAVGVLVAQVLPWIAATEASGAHAHTYLLIRMIGSPLALAYGALREHRYGVGDSRSPMWAAIAGNITNIGLDWLFIAGLGFGVEGVAWATIIGQSVQLGLLVSFHARGGFGLTQARWAHIRSIWDVGIPVGAQFFLEVGSFALLTAMLAAMGETDVAAHQIAIQVIHFTFLPILAVAEAGGVMAGQAVGAGRSGLVQRIARWAGMVAGGYAALWTVVLAIGSWWIAARFTDDQALIEATVVLLWFAAAFQVPDAAFCVARSVLQGTGDVRWPAVVGIVLAWVLTPPLAWGLGWEMGMGAVGGWLGITLEITIGAVVFWWRLERGGWRPAAEKSRSRLSEDAHARESAPPLAA